MTDQTQLHFKATTPENTIEKLQGILRELDIRVVEDFIEGNDFGISSLRLSIEGSEVGTNGKGINREFARASAYAEFFERLQNGLIDICSLNYKRNFHSSEFADDKIVSSAQLAALDNSYMRRLFATFNIDKLSVDERAERLATFDRANYIRYGEEGHELNVFYNLSTKSIDYLPVNFYFMNYGSNGMCAGNTREEALIQGLSEIFERYAQRKMMSEGVVFPDMPKEIIAEYPYIEEYLKKANSLPGYRAVLKDASLGGVYPVAMLLTTTQDTGKVGVKFGSHPDIGVAMERTFTEVMQGKSFENYSVSSDVDFVGNVAVDEINIYNSFKFGSANYPVSAIHNQNPTFEPKRVPDVRDKSNAEILRSLCEIVEREGFEIFVRDVSFLGFPSYHIIIPGMSEMLNFEERHVRGQNTRMYLYKYINDPELIDERICKYLIGALDMFANSSIENFMKNIYGCAYVKPVVGEELGLGWLYMTAMAEVYLGNYSAAASRLRWLITASEQIKSSGKHLVNVPYYRAAISYLTLRAKGEKHEYCVTVLRLMYSDEVIERLDNVFCDDKQVFVKQYEKHDLFHENSEPSEHCCDFSLVQKVHDKIYARRALNPIDQTKLGQVY